MQYLTALDKPKKLYAMLYGTEMPRNVETFIAMYCKAYDCNPDDAAITRHVLDAHLVHRLEGVPARFSEQVNKAYVDIKADIIKIANDCQPPGLFASAVAKFIFQFSDQRASC